MQNMILIKLIEHFLELDITHIGVGDGDHGLINPHPTP